ncbi:hypothetical protein LINPERHAP1_LOCUS15575, partial [Linum perenne]
VFTLCFVYGANKDYNRRLFYNRVGSNDLPTLHLGDFNAIRGCHDASNRGGWGGGSSSIEFNDWIAGLQGSEHPIVGENLTWTNNQVAKPISGRLDKILMNMAWLSSFPGSNAHYVYSGYSDHSGISLATDVTKSSPPKPFRFFKFWMKHPSFPDLLKKDWLEGRPVKYMGDLYHNLSNLKYSLKSLNWKHFSDLSEKVKSAENEVVIAQRLKSRNLAILEGDDNTRFFKVRQKKNEVNHLFLPDGSIVTELNDIAREVMNFYKTLLRSEDANVRVMDHGGSLWVAWSKYYRLKNDGIWSFIALPSTPWIWKTLIQCRDIAVPYITQDLDGVWLWG